MRIKVFLLSLSQHGIRAKGKNLILSSFSCHQLRETFRWPCFIPVTFPISQYFPVSRIVVRKHSPPANFSGELPATFFSDTDHTRRSVWRRSPTFVKASEPKDHPRAGHAQFSVRRLHLTRRRVRTFPATRLLLQPCLTPTSLPSSLVLPSEPCTYLFWGFLPPPTLQTVFLASFGYFFSILIPARA